MLSAQQWHTTIEIKHPAADNSLLKAGNLLIVNNCIQQPDDFGHTDKRNGKVTGAVTVDLQMAAMYMLFTVANTLDYSREFVSVGLVEQSQNNTGNFFSRTLLTKEQVSRLCQDYEADAVFALNSLVQYDKQDCYVNDDLHYYAYLEAFLSSGWTLHYPDGRQQNFSYADTLYWESEQVTSAEALNGLPDRQRALLDMCEYSAERFAERFVTSWSVEDRYMYENDDEGLKLGMEQFTRRRWGAAKEQFAVTYESRRSDKKTFLTAAYSAADAAVSAEMQGELTTAREWAKKSADMFGNIKGSSAMQQKINLLYYCRQLNERIVEQQKFVSR